MKAVSVVGARPQFIKAAMLSRELRKNHEEILVHTGQHFDANMSDVFFADLEIPNPKYNLGIDSLPREKMIEEMEKSIIPILEKENPDIVFVFGDTNSTLAAAEASKKLGIPVAHIEAGMRSYDSSMPEEKNRVATDRISSLLFCPTESSMKNLEKEAIITDQKKKIFVYNVGDIMVEMMKTAITLAEKKSSILSTLKMEKKNYIYATIHRASNTDTKENLRSILSALSQSPVPVVFPVHPRTKKAIESFGLGKLLESGSIIPVGPVSYYDSLVLEKNALKIVTDSGGMQKEAFIFMVPCITARNETEWTETAEEGWNLLVGADKSKILGAIKNFSPEKKQSSPFGSGNATKKIVELTESYLNLR